MGAKINVCLHVAGFTGYSAPLDLNSRIPSPEPTRPGHEIPQESEVLPLDAYKIAVLIAAAAATLSLCL